jgi:hypothetical protein
VTTATGKRDKIPTLPRLLYLGDVPVESACHGSALLFRLLRRYPVERLSILEAAENRSVPERRLPGVNYAQLGPPPGAFLKRLGRSRFCAWARAWQSVTARGRASRISMEIHSFQPEAMLTVAQGHSWLAAAAYCERRSLPLHLIIHDDWPTLAGIPRMFDSWCARVFSRVYRQARSRFCVSPHMEEMYRQRYGLPGSVLYPARADDLPEYVQPPARAVSRTRAMTVAFAGSLFTDDYVRQLRNLSQALENLGGSLVLYGPHTHGGLARMGLDRPNVTLRGMHSSADLVCRLRDEADALFLPMSFAPEDALAMALNFPSKLTDYTAAGLPILICGPEGTSAVRWARAEPGVAEIVTDSSVEALRRSLERLADSVDLRLRLGARAIETGKTYFQAQRARVLFEECLSNPPALHED